MPRRSGPEGTPGRRLGLLSRPSSSPLSRPRSREASPKESKGGPGGSPPDVQPRRAARFREIGRQRSKRPAGGRRNRGRREQMVEPHTIPQQPPSPRPRAIPRAWGRAAWAPQRANAVPKGGRMTSALEMLRNIGQLGSVARYIPIPERNTGQRDGPLRAGRGGRAAGGPAAEPTWPEGADWWKWGYGFFAPAWMQTRRLAVRMKRRPAAATMVERHGEPPMRMRASTLNWSPAARTTASPALLMQ